MAIFRPLAKRDSESRLVLDSYKTFLSHLHIVTIDAVQCQDGGLGRGQEVYIGITVSAQQAVIDQPLLPLKPKLLHDTLP